MAAIYCYFMIHTIVAKKKNCANYICIFRKCVNNAEANTRDLIVSTRSKNVIREICFFSITFLWQLLTFVVTSTGNYLSLTSYHTYMQLIVLRLLQALLLLCYKSDICLMQNLAQSSNALLFRKKMFQRKNCQRKRNFS